MSEQPSVFQRLLKTFQFNQKQLAFGSYAAELSFYIIWAIVPLMLALANVISVLPFSPTDIVATIKDVLPSQVQGLLLPLLEDYLSSTSSGAFSLGLIISLWPASNVFNTIQRVFNTIYKAEPRKNALIARMFSYVFTIAFVLVGVFLGFAVLYGETFYQAVKDIFGFDFALLEILINQSGLIGFALLALVLLIIYQFIPNVNWTWRYSIPGTLFALLGFTLISQLFGLVVSMMGRSTSNQTIGVFIILLIWLYFNAMVIAIGAFINVFYHDFKEKIIGKSQTK